MTAAVFLDRDGVINAAIVAGGLPRAPRTLHELAFEAGVDSACHRLKEIGRAHV